MTVEALVNPVNLTPASQAIARKNGQYLIRLDNAGRLIFRLWKGGVVTELLRRRASSRPGAWNAHRRDVRRHDDAGLRERHRARAAIAGGPGRRRPSSRLYLGSSDGYDYLNGRLDEVATYPSALSAAQIASHNSAR